MLEGIISLTTQLINELKIYTEDEINNNWVFNFQVIKCKNQQNFPSLHCKYIVPLWM